MAACFEPVMNAIFDAEKEELEFQKLFVIRRRNICLQLIGIG